VVVVIQNMVVVGIWKMVLVGIWKLVAPELKFCMKKLTCGVGGSVSVLADVVSKNKKINQCRWQCFCGGNAAHPAALMTLLHCC